jgi:TolB-like protein/Tfp pilus assembly protein PilF
LSFFNELKRRNVIRIGAAYVVVAWLIIQVAETIFPLFGFDDSPARIAVIVLAVGFIPVLIITWAFELTPDGLKRDGEVDRSHSLTPQTGRKLDKTIMVVLAVALGFFAIDKFVLDPQRDAELVAETAQQVRSDALVGTYGDHSIAVLPFADMSQSGDQQYLSDGLAEELLNLLVQVDGLRVASRSSTFNLRDESLSVSEIAKRLNVAHVLEGSVRMAADQLRVTVQLIEAGSDTHLWSQTYDRKLDNIFKIQDDIAARVVDKLKVNLMGAAPVAEEVDPEAYQLVLQAGFLMRRANPDESQKIIDLLVRAVEIDPDYFKAWYYLGDIYQRQAIWGIAPEEEALSRSREANRRAAELAPDSAAIHIRMGWMAMSWDNDLEQAAVHIQRAMDLTEDPIQKVTIAGQLLRQLGRTELLLKLAEYRVHETPTDAQSQWNLAQSYAWEGQYTKSIQHLNTALILSPGIDNGNGFLSYVLLLDGQFEAALETAALEKLPIHRMPVTVMALDELGRHEEALQIFEDMVKEEQVDRTWQVEIYARRGDKDRAFEILNDLSVDDGEIGYWLLEEPVYKLLHSDPRWQTLVERISLTSVKPTHIKLEVPTPEEWQ